MGWRRSARIGWDVGWRRSARIGWDVGWRRSSHKVGMHVVVTRAQAFAWEEGIPLFEGGQDGGERAWEEGGSKGARARAGARGYVLGREQGATC